MAAARQDCTPKGIRDYAILTLLARYGTRAGEIAALRLNDVDWGIDCIRIRHTKTGATSHLPLLPEVGEAILALVNAARGERSAILTMRSTRLSRFMVRK